MSQVVLRAPEYSLDIVTHTNLRIRKNPLDKTKKPIFEKKN